jgi:hypothetical protein
MMATLLRTIGASIAVKLSALVGAMDATTTVAEYSATDTDHFSTRQKALRRHILRQLDPAQALCLSKVPPPSVQRSMGHIKLTQVTVTLVTNAS